ncbi:hypothetical protein A2424_05740 [Candidatus Peribacteria bacterium RIFOXYC1_FULL_54_13]|nr:MAG: hypothetical protein UY90_C0085G0004 [Candidatus Peregrinibacteria bacterium GW2011_GWA2_54_9]KKW40467.1 MAG: hypothetical protein UY87_C0021G0012 [Candidatus Peribacteria bacterium GW2011_GWC2_54_8]OGJ72046.1 MAG: hypothetical protein A2198_04190 [Candidatus Peribacteria bacterium RIFOXYA1_FULL_56_14]OGJ74057.1 MAG: hypothetical protein A2217_00215 [Candidatus Peribacteria bacterium RIFOXYA2_FULL_55_28]OGJ75488.1 MAG: hypothetical protein A2384_01175 [Candidatus Peribacteria bacterium 
MDTPLYHLIVYVPHKDADAIRSALAEAGAGNIGHYDSCSFSTPGTGRFRPDKDADPAIGAACQLTEVKEERIEVVVPKATLKEVLHAVIKAHPYEEPAIHVLPMLDYHDLL